MARIRTIKPEFFRSRSLARCSVHARLTFQGMWTEADDHGRGIADPRLLVASVWPLDDDVTAVHVESHLSELADTHHITLYEVDGERYYHITNWEKHQAAAYRRGDPLHPSPPAETPTPQTPHDETCKKVQDARSDVLEQGTGNREQGTGNREAPASLALVAAKPVDDSFELFWSQYPERNGKKLEKKKAQEQWRKLSTSEREAALIGVVHYAKSDVLAKDAHRWLRDKCWTDWQTPAKSRNASQRVITDRSYTGPVAL